MRTPILCSDCFKVFGLRKVAKQMGIAGSAVCPNCGSRSGVLLDEGAVAELCRKYFVDGSYHSGDFGGSPSLMMIDSGCGYESDLEFEYATHNSLQHDLELILKKTGKMPLSYGPALWRLGLTEWMEQLMSRNWKKRDKAINDLIDRCGIKEVGKEAQFYRIRTNANDCVNEKSYDAPPTQSHKGGRLNVRGGVVFYASFDVETCIHECRVSMEDTLYLATLAPCRTLRLLNVCDVREKESEQTPFEYLPLAINQLFMADGCAYRATRRISELTKERGFDGIIYPSYFNRVAGEPNLNIALYGQVIGNKTVRVKSLDRILLSKVKYKYDFGPCIG